MSDGYHHCVACKNCPRYKWGDSAEEAERSAEKHEELNRGHDTYTGSAAVNIGGFGTAGARNAWVE